MTLLLVIALSGCAPTKQQKDANRAVGDYFMGNFQRAKERLRPAAKTPDENFVLNNVRLGSVALADYDLSEAEDAFLRAYEVINSVGVNDGGRSLGAALVSENIKIWKGEPFERAMANYYLGLIYYMHQDYNNARGAFENALFKLRDYADKKEIKKEDYREQESNFVIGLVMLGKCWQKLGRDDLARANFDHAKQLRPDLAGLFDYDRNLDANLLLVVEFGSGPEKVTDGDGAIVGFGPLPGEAGQIPSPVVMLDARTIDISPFNQPPIDLLAMAQDRKWQSIDTIRTVKSTLGTGLIIGGAAAGIYGLDRNRGDVALAGLAAAGAGLLLKASSKADVRQWEMLPRTVFLLPLHVPPGTHDLTVSFPHTDGLRQSWRDIVVPSTGEATYYIRMQRYGPVERTWPPLVSEPEPSLAKPPR